MCAMNVLVPNDEQLVPIDQADAFRLIADFTYECEMWLGPNRELLYISPRANVLPATTHCYELDQPELLAYKDAILDTAGAKPSCERTPVGIDLTGPRRETLLAAGFDADTPACWLLEGFLFYLPNEVVTGQTTSAKGLPRR